MISDQRWRFEILEMKHDIVIDTFIVQSGIYYTLMNSMKNMYNVLRIKYHQLAQDGGNLVYLRTRICMLG